MVNHTLTREKFMQQPLKHLKFEDLLLNTEVVSTATKEKAVSGSCVNKIHIQRSHVTTRLRSFGMIILPTPASITKTAKLSYVYHNELSRTF